MKKNGFVFGLLAIGAFIALITACDQTTGAKNGEKAITAFVIGLKQAEINDPVITIELPQGTDVTNLAPRITVSEKASVSPASGVARDFSDSITYTVTAEDGTTKDYIVIVTIAGDEPNDTRTMLVAGPDVYVDYTATTATATFTGPADLTGLTAADFAVTGGASIYNPMVNGNTVTIQVGFGANTDASVKTYIVSIAPTSTKIKGSSTVTITQQAFIDPNDTRTLLAAGPDVYVDHTATTATATFTGPAGLTGLIPADFVVTGGASIYNPTVNGNTVTIQVGFGANTDASVKTYIVSIAPTSTKIKGSSSVTITQQAFIDPGDTRTLLVAVQDVSVDYTDTRATATFTGAAGLTGLTAADFAVTGGVFIYNNPTVNGDTVTVEVNFVANTDTFAKTYVVRIAPTSTKIRGDTFVTITQAFNGDPRTSLYVNGRVDVLYSATVAAVQFYGAYGLTGLTGLTAADFAVTGGASINNLTVDGNIVTVEVYFGENADAFEKTYVVSIASTSTKIKGDGTCTITQALNPGDVIIDATNIDQMTELIRARYYAGGGRSSDRPVVVKVTIDDASLLSGNNSSGVDPLHKLFFGLIDVYVAYDLSGCTFSEIPNFLSGNVPVVRQNREYLASITLPDTLISIGNYAFVECIGLTSVTIGNSVTSIGDSAFAVCSGLTSVTIGDSVTSIDDSAFAACIGLTTVTIPDSVTSIGDSAFGTCRGLTSVTIPNSVTHIGDGAFNVCSNLSAIQVNVSNWTYTAIDGVLFNKSGTVLMAYPAGKGSTYTIPASVTSIGNRAFTGYSGLTTVTIPNSVTSIGNNAFTGCSGLTTVTIPDSVTSIGNSAFSSCSGLTSVTIGNSVTSIGNDAFKYCSGLASVVINNNYVVTDFKYIFSDCSGLTSVTIGNSVTSISSSAFTGCSGLTSVTIGNSVTYIGQSAFEGCSGLTTVTIGNSVTYIGQSAFQSCSGLTSVTIGNSVTSINNFAFSGCSGLTSVYVLRVTTPLTTLGSGGFTKTAASLVIYVPTASVATTYRVMDGWSSYASRIQVGTP
ncbi:hypothetical protein FACS189479_06090 [Spirochaetia bacterium]|nr:hypothetical protein FACS189479_06090 [Spirochaetia bacterium]